MDELFHPPHDETGEMLPRLLLQDFTDSYRRVRILSHDAHAQTKNVLKYNQKLEIIASLEKNEYLCMV